MGSQGLGPVSVSNPTARVSNPSELQDGVAKDIQQLPSRLNHLYMVVYKESSNIMQVLGKRFTTKNKWLEDQKRAGGKTTVVVFRRRTMMTALRLCETKLTMLERCVATSETFTIDD